jgi:hypothetical protein
MNNNSLTYADLIGAFNKIPKIDPHENPVMFYMNELSVPLFGDLVNEDRMMVYLSGIPIKFSDHIPFGTTLAEMEDGTIRILV